MLRWRLILGAVFIGALVGLCWLDWRASPPGSVLLPLAILAALLAAGELVTVFRKRGHDPCRSAIYAGTLLTILSAAVPGLWPELAAGPLGQLGWLAMGLVAGFLLALVAELCRYDGSGQGTVHLSLAVFAIAYVGGLFGMLVELRLFGGGDGHVGMFALVSLIAIVKLSDIGQYTAGRLFGKHKLAPKLSPGKTWEGVLGGVVLAFVAAWWMTQQVAPAMSLVSATSSPSLVQLAVLVVALVAAGIIGDLAESMLKRDAGVKDSSTWLPGFGGVLDLVDSLLVAAPVAYFAWAMGWVRT